MHRGIPERGPWWKVGRDLLMAAVILGILCTLFIVGDLLLYGRVNW